MASVNNVLLIGRVGQKLESTYSAAGTCSTVISLATSKKFKNKDGATNERTTWHRIKVWGRMAENAVKYVGKGDLISVEGSLETSSWESNGQKRYITEVIANRVHYLELKSRDRGMNQEHVYSGDDIPF